MTSIDVENIVLLEGQILFAYSLVQKLARVLTSASRLNRVRK